MLKEMKEEARNDVFAEFKIQGRHQPFVITDFPNNTPLMWTQVKAGKDKHLNFKLTAQMANMLATTFKPAVEKTENKDLEWTVRPDATKAKIIRTIAIERGEGNKLLYATVVFHRGHAKDDSKTNKLSKPSSGGRSSNSSSSVSSSEETPRKGEIYSKSTHTLSSLRRLLKCPVVLQLDRDDYSCADLVEIVKQNMFKYRSHNSNNRKKTVRDFEVSGSASLGFF